MNPKLTDQAVAELPLSAGRADLLEEIMSTPLIDNVTRGSEKRPDRPARNTRWLVPVAAAAAVAIVATAPAWWPGGGSSPSPAPQPAPAAPVAPAEPATGYRAVLDAPGWQVDNVEEEVPFGGSISYRQGDSYLEVSWTAGKYYADYVEDREHIVDPPAPGEPVEVLGAPGQLWAYSATDHTVIREVQQKYWMEFRGGGMDKAAYLALLGRLRLVDVAGFEAALPAKYVTEHERSQEVMRVLGEIEKVAGAGLPAESTVSVTSDESDPYHLGADVAGRYACAWLTEFEEARAAGATARADEAVRVLGTSRRWPVLRQMDERGDYPEVLWGYADRVAAGEAPEGYREGLGC